MRIFHGSDIYRKSTPVVTPDQVVGAATVLLGVIVLAITFFEVLCRAVEWLTPVVLMVL
jgi:hypothetical protein